MGNEHIYTVLGEEYANVRGFDKEKCIRLILEATKNRTNNEGTYFRPKSAGISPHSDVSIWRW